MYLHLLSSIARIFGWLPLPVNRMAGSLLGRIAWMANTRARRITQFNLRHCFPDESEEELHKLARLSLRHTGQQLTECGWIWNRPRALTWSKITQVRGEQLFDDAIASSRGIIMVSPHVGNWELNPMLLSAKTPMIYFYRDARDQALGSLILKWRTYIGGRPIRLDSSGIRESLKLLKKGGVVGILPDQEPDTSNGVFAPFFNQPALTMTLLSRLAQRSNAQVLYIVMERLPSGANQKAGWRAHFLAADPDTANADPVLAAAAVNRDVERCIAVCPEQYLWSYKRFNLQPDGTRRKYR